MITFKFYLDTRTPQLDGRCLVRLIVTAARKSAYQTTGISVHPNQWDKAAQRVIKHPNAFAFNSQLDALRTKINDRLFTLSREDAFKGKSITQIRDLLVKDEQEAAPALLFKTCFDNFNATHSGRTAVIYDTTWQRILAFNPKAETLPLDAIDRKWLETFDAFLAKTSPSANARAIHMRNIRAVFNYAIDEELTTAYPFRKFKIKQEKTRKRALAPAKLRNLAALPLRQQAVYRDLFMLTFYLIGINFVDLCGLTDIKDGRIEYRRAKTHRLYSIKVEPEALAIIQRLRGEGHLLYMLDNHKDYRSYYRQLRRGLGVVLNTYNETYPTETLTELTTYWARHSWATIAASLDIPKETIAAALGHGGSETTDIYIDFDRKKIDAANRRVIDYVLYGKE